jgi:alpha-L-fucosidase
MKNVACLLALFGAGLVLSAAGMDSPQGATGDIAAAETPARRDARMQWFREARFGLFIHWGVYSVPAGVWDGKPAPGTGEWIQSGAKIPASQYAKLPAQFNPVKFNAREWVALAKNAGMKYIVITSKHHDGFAMYPSALTGWSIKSTPFGRDPLKELADACRDAGLKLCFYYSIMDWHHPDYTPRKPWNDLATSPPDLDRYTAFLKGQLKELLTGYGPVGILWFDGEWEDSWTRERGIDLCNYVRALQPDIIVNNRVGKARAGMAGMDTGSERLGDYGTPEQNIPAKGFGPGVDWESCMTMNDTWGFKKQDHNWKSTTTLVRNLVDCASKGGNYLLNVGPTDEGLIPQPSVDRLQEIGRWMAVNAEAIHGTTASPFDRQLPWGRCTSKTSPTTTTLYLHVFDWPADGRLTVAGLKEPPEKTWLLADAEQRPLAVQTNDDGLTITVPKAAPDPISSTVVLQIKNHAPANH